MFSENTERVVTEQIGEHKQKQEDISGSSCRLFLQKAVLPGGHLGRSSCFHLERNKKKYYLNFINT